MLSSYRVIKNNSVIEEGKKQINTEYTTEKNKELGEKNAKDFIESYEVLARTMLENARRQSDKILAAAYAEAQNIEQEAYRKGYEEGKKAGYETGVAKANEYYEEMKSRAEYEAKTLGENAEVLLYGARQEYFRYMEEKQGEIKELILYILECILKKEIDCKDGISSMILDAIEIAQKSKTLIVKCNNSYTEDIKVKLEAWKNQSVFRGEIFVITDDNLEEGTAEIQRENGKIIVSVSEALQKVREIIETS